MSRKLRFPREVIPRVDEKYAKVIERHIAHLEACIAKHPDQAVDIRAGIARRQFELNRLLGKVGK